MMLSERLTERKDTVWFRLYDKSRVVSLQKQSSTSDRTGLGGGGGARWVWTQGQSVFPEWSQRSEIDYGVNWENAKSYWIAHFKWANCIACDFYINRTFF